MLMKIIMLIHEIIARWLVSISSPIGRLVFKNMDKTHKISTAMEVSQVYFYNTFQKQCFAS